MIRTHQNKAQTLNETAIVLAVVIGVLLVMGTYVRRGLNGRMKDSGDSFGEQYDPRNGTYLSIINETGGAESVVGREKIGDVHYQVTYQAVGPAANGAVIPADPTRRNMTETTIKRSRINWN